MSALSLPLLAIAHGLKPSFPPFSAPLRKAIRKLPVLHNAGHGAKPARASAGEGAPAVAVENSDSDESTLFVIRARNRIGLLQVVARVFGVLGLRIDRASVEFEGDFFVKKFFVTDSRGKKIDDAESLERIRSALIEAIDGDGDVSVGPATRGVVVRRLGLGTGSEERRAKAERMFEMMDRFLKNDPISLQKDILNHVEYTVARSRFNFDDFEAYQVMLLHLFFNFIFNIDSL